MNGYMNNNMFSGGPIPNNNTASPTSNGLFEEQSYIENILRLNKGKKATFYMSYPDSVEWRDQVVTGIILAAGRDHIIIKEEAGNRRYLLLMIYLNYVIFDETVNYEYKR